MSLLPMVSALSAGQDGVSYVADNGQEMFTHTYGSMVRCCIAVDKISFAYIAHHEKDRKYYCHAFQALTYEDVSISIMWRLLCV